MAPFSRFLDAAIGARESHEMEAKQPTIVLVHGAWHDRRCWERVTALLDLRRVPWTSLTLPSTDPGPNLPGFADDVAAVVDLVGSLDTDVTLCGHGYGGMVISEAGNDERVSRLVYLAAHCPWPGQSVADLSPRRQPVARREPDGRTSPRLDRAARFLYGSLRPDDAAARVAMLAPSTASILRAPSVAPAWLTKEATFVWCRFDRMISQRRSRRMGNDVVRNQIANGRASTHLAVLDTDHSPFYSAPERVVELLVNPLSARTSDPSPSSRLVRR